jgi:hypothetical protein
MAFSNSFTKADMLLKDSSSLISTLHQFDLVNSFLKHLMRKQKPPDLEDRGSLNRESLKVLILGSRVCRVCVVEKT